MVRIYRYYSLRRRNCIGAFPFNVRVRSMCRFQVITTSSDCFVFHVSSAITILIFMFSVAHLYFTRLQLEPIINFFIQLRWSRYFVARVLTREISHTTLSQVIFLANQLWRIGSFISDPDRVTYGEVIRITRIVTVYSVRISASIICFACVNYQRFVSRSNQRVHAFTRSIIYLFVRPIYFRVGFSIGRQDVCASVRRFEDFPDSVKIQRANFDMSQNCFQVLATGCNVATNAVDKRVLRLASIIYSNTSP